MFFFFKVRMTVSLYARRSRLLTMLRELKDLGLRGKEFRVLGPGVSW